jgi:hypothetical protein
VRHGAAIARLVDSPVEAFGRDFAIFAEYVLIRSPAPDPVESAGGFGLSKGGPFMDTSHLSALQLKHAGIERQLHKEMSRPLPDDALVQDLKKQKLRIKEQMLRH